MVVYQTESERALHTMIEASLAGLSLNRRLVFPGSNSAASEAKAWRGVPT
jgi:hypothetical protein